MMKTLTLLLILLLCGPAFALPESGKGDPRAIAGSLPADCSVVLAITLTPSRWSEILGQEDYERALNVLGAQGFDWNGALFVGLYRHELLWGFDDGSKWNLVSPDSLGAEFAQESAFLSRKDGFKRVSTAWQGGPFFLYVGDLTEPGPEMRAFFEEYPEAVPPGLKDRSVSVPHLCLGYQEGRLQGWLWPIAPEAKDNAVWNPLLGGDPRLGEAGTELSRWSAELVEFLEGMGIILPIEYKLFILGRRSVSTWGKRPLPLVILEALNFEEPGRGQMIPAIESLTHLGDGLWHYELDSRSTKEVVGKAKVMLTLLKAPQSPPSTEDVCGSQLRNIGTALEMYYADYQHYPATLEALTPEYLRELPRCPTPNSSDYRYSLQRESYLVVCEGRQHRENDYPRYSSVDGLVTEP